MKKDKKPSPIIRLLAYTGNYKGLLFSGLFLSAIAMVLGMAPYICIWLVIKDLISVAPNWSEAASIAQYGWMAFAFAVGGILIYFFALMCTHLAAFRTASNIRKQGMARLMKTPLGFFDNNASGLLRNRLDGAAGETETLLAHNLADIVGTAAMFIAMLVLMFLFDWRMGAACLLAAVISIVAMFTMMGGKNAKLMMEYQSAQDVMSKAGTEYVRGIPVVKVFQQTVYSFKAFKQAIEDYSTKAERYTDGVCRVPQSVNLTFTEAAFVFLIPVALFLAPSALASGDFAGFITNFAFYAVFSAIISTALAKIMFAASGTMIAETALNRIEQVMNAPVLEITENPKTPDGNKVEFKNVSFTYDGAQLPALNNVSFIILEPHILMDNVAFVFQNNRLFKTSILENVRAAKPDADRREVQKALDAAQCGDILEKLPDGMDTVIGSKGTFLSGGEQQRIALARAILKDAPIIVLDEATAFADPENEVLIQKAFSVLTKGKTVIKIAHRLSTVTDADKIIVLDNGKVVETGTHEQLKNADGLYSKMWKEYNKAAQWKIQSEVR